MKRKLRVLSGKKKLDARGTEIEIVLVDATEQPVEHPQKDTANTTAVKRGSTRRKRK